MYYNVYVITHNIHKLLNYNKMIMMMRYIPIIMIIICVDIVYANSVKKINTIAVIGGGAAGYFSAIQCANIIENNENRYTTTIDCTVYIY